MPRKLVIRLLLLFLGGFLGGSFLPAESTPLTELKSCTLVRTEWADGDSFLVRTPDGENHTVRLYGVDCLEASVHDSTDARRLSAQRRYFGITRIDPDPKEAIEIAKSFGEKARKETMRVLGESFTVHTAFADARGDGRHPRIYGFVTTRDGKDLAAHLVSQGLARAYGVSRESPEGKSRDDYQEALRDLELRAAKQGQGIWSLTDWDSLVAERKIQREEEAEEALAIDDSKLAPGTKINPNTAARDDLMRLPGIGETYANRIIEGRPYQKLDDLLRIKGVGPVTLEKITPFLTLESP